VLPHPHRGRGSPQRARFKSGDGDTGSTLATAARALIGALDRLPLADQTQLYRAIGLELSQTMGGSSGVLLAIFFSAAGDASAAGQDPIGALKAGLDRIQQVGGARPGDRTLIDALFPALEALPSGLDAAARAAREGADATARITRARAGRASYLAEANLAGHNDPGAEAVACLLEALPQSATASAGVWPVRIATCSNASGRVWPSLISFEPLALHWLIVVSRAWRKVKVDWDAWAARSLAEEDIVRLILDGTVIRTRLDRKATNISVLSRRARQMALSITCSDCGARGPSSSYTCNRMPRPVERWSPALRSSRAMLDA
jgi:hypothetical protein